MSHGGGGLKWSKKRHVLFESPLNYESQKFKLPYENSRKVLLYTYETFQKLRVM
jgi:hypothetical protein